MRSNLILQNMRVADQSRLLTFTGRALQAMKIQPITPITAKDEDVWQLLRLVYSRYGSHWSSSMLSLYYWKQVFAFERSEGEAADMYGPIEEDDFSDVSDLGPSTSGLQLPTGVRQQKSTNPDWNSDESSDLEINEVKEIPSTIKQSQEPINIYGLLAEYKARRWFKWRRRFPTKSIQMVSWHFMRCWNCIIGRVNFINISRLLLLR